MACPFPDGNRARETLIQTGLPCASGTIGGMVEVIGGGVIVSFLVNFGSGDNSVLFGRLIFG